MRREQGEFAAEQNSKEAEALHCPLAKQGRLVQNA
jgi:hypothetical protein